MFGSSLMLILFVNLLGKYLFLKEKAMKQNLFVTLTNSDLSTFSL